MANLKKPNLNVILNTHTLEKLSAQLTGEVSRNQVTGEDKEVL